MSFHNLNIPVSCLYMYDDNLICNKGKDTKLCTVAMRNEIYID